MPDRAHDEYRIATPCSEHCRMRSAALAPVDHHQTSARGFQAANDPRTGQRIRRSHRQPLRFDYCVDQGVWPRVGSVEIRSPSWLRLPGIDRAQGDGPAAACASGRQEACAGCDHRRSLRYLESDNVARLKTRLMPQGANIPCSPEARSRCARLGVLVIPDFIANAGGVIGASIELRGGTERAAFDYIDERIRSNTRLVLEESRRTGEVPRVAAMALAQKRVTRLPRPDAGRSSFHSRFETATRA